ncbi:MAG: glycosyltransferase [Planctomycetota bacterium]|nr:glycosyltransferase [Planctomycetota bacterium]MDA1178607.1 glycosyltransferase [Planctomycetota bacterium]
MPHRIIHLIPTLDRSGAEKQLSLLATRLPRDEFEVEVCALTRGGPWHSFLEQSGIPVRIIGKSWKLDPRAMYELYRHISAKRPTILHTWLFAANSYGRIAARWARVPHIIASERCVDPWKATHEFAIDRWLQRRTDVIVVNSQGTRDFYSQHGIADGKFEVIPNGIDANLPNGFLHPPAKDSPATGPRNTLRESLGIGASAELIVTVGRLWPQKRIKDLIWAADLLKGVRPDTHLLIVGDGPQRYLLERYRNAIQIQDRVHFLGHRDDVVAILRQASCFWLASDYEGQSNALMEAMSLGIPSVASDIVGNRELMQNEVTGYLVPVGDSATFARKTQLILNDKEHAAKLGAAAQRVMRADFTVEAMISRHIDLYRRVLGNTRSSH